MQELLKFIIGIVVLALGIPVGNYLAKLTKEELSSGQKWFRVLIIICLIGAILALIFKDDALLFGLLFIAIVTSQSLKGKKKAGKKRKPSP